MYYLMFHKGQLVQTTATVGELSFIDYKELPHSTFVYNADTQRWTYIRHINRTVNIKPIKDYMVPRKLKLLALLHT